MEVNKRKTDENFGKYFKKKDIEEKLNMSHDMSISLNENEVIPYDEFMRGEIIEEVDLQQDLSINPNSSRILEKVTEIIDS